jgi:hypothetical protein
VTGRVGKDIAGQPAGSDLQDAAVSIGHVIDHYVQVDLLRVLRIRPARGDVIGSKLERKSRVLLVVGYHYPIITVVSDR